MTYPLHMTKNQSGFTLVEIIVVSAIVAVLAAVAVPAYLHYIADSRTSTAENAASQVASFSSTCLNGEGSLLKDNALVASGFQITGQPESGSELACRHEGTGSPMTRLKIPVRVSMKFISSEAGYDGGLSPGNSRVQAWFEVKSNRGDTAEVHF